MDSLHRLAGSDCLTELHGCGGRVRCLGCGFVTTRDAFQRVLLARNPSWSSTLKAGANDATRSLGEIRPDGDVVLVPGAEATFEIPSCPRCTDDPSTRDLPALPESVDGEPHGMPFTGTKNPALRGVLITDIVFMGGNVPRAVVDRVNAHVDACDALLVLGSSLQTYSAYRIVDRAHQRRLPIAIVNIGPTRADPLQKAPTGEKLPDSLFLRLRCRIGHLLPPAIELLQSFPKVRG